MEKNHKIVRSGQLHNKLSKTLQINVKISNGNMHYLKDGKEFDLLTRPSFSRLRKTIYMFRQKKQVIQFMENLRHTEKSFTEQKTIVVQSQGESRGEQGPQCCWSGMQFTSIHVAQIVSV